MIRSGAMVFVLGALLPLAAVAQVNVPAPLQGVDVIEQLGDRRAIDLRGFIELQRNELAVLVQDQQCVWRGERDLGRNDRPQAVAQPVHAHQVHERDHQELLKAIRTGRIDVYRE